MRKWLANEIFSWYYGDTELCEERMYVFTKHLPLWYLRFLRWGLRDIRFDPNYGFLYYWSKNVKQVYPELIPHEIVGVQPLCSPVGLVFAMKYYYE